MYLQESLQKSSEPLTRVHGRAVSFATLRRAHCDISHYTIIWSVQKPLIPDLANSGQLEPQSSGSIVSKPLQLLDYLTYIAYGPPSAKGSQRSAEYSSEGSMTNISCQSWEPKGMQSPRTAVQRMTLIIRAELCVVFRPSRFGPNA